MREQQISILQDICKSAGLLPGAPGEGKYIARAMGWALNKTGIAMQPAPMQPVLVTLGDRTRTTNFRFEPQRLNLEPGFFPKENISVRVDAQLATLKKELEQYNGDLEQMLRVLEWQGSTIACHPDFPDIAVYDYIKTAAAIAFCLNAPGNTGNLRLIAASVSGIQTYLYDIISKNAAKLLKGRSFYVQLLADSLLDELLNTLKLAPYHVVYASGGGFYVLVPDTPDIQREVADFFKKAAAQIYQKHKTTLFVDWVISTEFDEQVQIDAIWDDLLILLNRRKFKRLAGNPALWQDFYKPAEFGGTAEKDPITNVEFGPDEKPVPLNEQEEVTVLVSVLTKQQIETGRALRDANFWATSASRAFLSTPEFEIQDPFGKYHWLEEKDAKPDGAGQFRAINKIAGNVPAAFYGGNRIPVVEQADLAKVPAGEQAPKVGSIKMFDLMAQGESLDRIGVLRMDVDNLGAILSNNAAAAYGLNFARYAAISRSLDWFFKGYLNTLHENYRRHALIIYSGGDDLFILGRWREVLEMAKEIRSAFQRWTCHNPMLTISGGITFVTGKFPVMQAAKMAKKAEEAAKKHCTPDDSNRAKSGEACPEGYVKGKNAFTLFDAPLHWDKEFPIVESLKNDMLDMFREKHLNNSFLGKVTAHALSRHFQEPDHTPENFKKYRRVDPAAKPLPPRWRWVMAYDLSRYRDTLKNAGARAFVDRVMQDAFSNNRHNGKVFKSQYHYLDLLLLAARWTELQLRTEGKSISSDKT